MTVVQEATLPVILKGLVFLAHLIFLRKTCAKALTILSLPLCIINTKGYIQQTETGFHTIFQMSNQLVHVFSPVVCTNLLDERLNETWHLEIRLVDKELRSLFSKTV